MGNYSHITLEEDQRTHLVPGKRGPGCGWGSMAWRGLLRPIAEGLPSEESNGELVLPSPKGQCIFKMSVLCSDSPRLEMASCGKSGGGSKHRKLTLECIRKVRGVNENLPEFDACVFRKQYRELSLRNC